jgi:mRNA interferase RelE/StbE
VSYQLTLKGSAQKEFMRLPPQVRAQVAARLDLLQQNPRPAGAQALSGQLTGLLRIRVGDYRVVYAVDDDARSVIITRVRHRGRAYT